MKFNKSLLPVIFCWLTLLSCSSQPARESAQAVAAKTTSASLLPAGPVTPNPYLQNKPILSAATAAQFQAAVANMQQKKWDQAQVLLQTLANENPKMSGVQLNLGIVYRAKGEGDKAAAAFAQAIQSNPQNLDAYNQLAILQREAGKFGEAESLYQQALAVWPFHSESHKNIAILYELYLGKPEQALPHYLAYQQLLAAPDKQVDSWIADLQRRLNPGKKAAAGADRENVQAEEK